MTIRLRGELEIDQQRGVVYFHVKSSMIAEKYKALTILRIQGLPAPIPDYQQLDIAHMKGCSWDGESS